MARGCIIIMARMSPDGRMYKETHKHSIVFFNRDGSDGFKLRQHFEGK